MVFIKSAKATTPEEELLVQFQGMIAERSRRGKRYRAKAGSVNVLSGAPCGYRYHKKREISVAYYEPIERETQVVRNVFKLYTEDGLSIGAIARQLNDQGISTRTGKKGLRGSKVMHQSGAETLATKEPDE